LFAWLTFIQSEVFCDMHFLEIKTTTLMLLTSFSTSWATEADLADYF